jgi:hypothetical protein
MATTLRSPSKSRSGPGDDATTAKVKLRAESSDVVGGGAVKLTPFL